jgi:acetyl-CoA carboxylase biotin carboxyl carrier protein
MDDHESEQQTLRALLALMHEHDLERLKVKLGDAIYEIDRRLPADASVIRPSAAAAPLAEQAEMPAVAGPHVKRVAAPLTGVFYRSSSPDAEAFVDVGDRVEAGDVLCILEAMKLFNEIQSDYVGTVARILPENGELVSQGAELFWIEP